VILISGYNALSKGKGQTRYTFRLSSCGFVDRLCCCSCIDFYMPLLACAKVLPQLEML
jgi:hypothetical protein